MSLARTLVTGGFLAATAFCALPAQAAVLFDNLSNVAGNYAIGAHGGDAPLAQSFSVGSPDNFQLSNVAVSLVASASPGTGSFVVTLNSDASGAPGSLLLVLGTVFDVDATPLMNFWGQGYALSTGRYWIEVTDTNPGGGSSLNDSTTAWNLASDEAGVGVPGEYYLTSAGVQINDGNNPLVMSVETPEPVSIALLGVGIAGLGWARARRKRAAA